MKIQFVRLFVLLVFISVTLSVRSQCEVLNRLSPDGTMLYYMEPVNFYWTKSKDLKGNLVTDKENYFLSLQPRPFPEKAQGKKLKGDLELKLANGKFYQLKHFDTHYVENDTVMEMFFLIDKRDLNDLLNFQALQVKMDMKGSEGVRTYVFKLHKGALQEQLSCFLKNEEEKNTKK